MIFDCSFSLGVFPDQVARWQCAEVSPAGKIDEFSGLQAQYLAQSIVQCFCVTWRQDGVVFPAVPLLFALALSERYHLQP